MRSGFTLIELLLVMALISTIAAVAVLAGGSSIKWRSLNGDGTALYSLCRQARAMAISQSKRTRVEVDTALRTFKLTLEDDPDVAADTFTSPQGTWYQPIPYDGSVTLTLSDRSGGETAPTWVTFNPDGTADPIDLELTHPDLEERIKISVNELTSLPTLEVLYGQE
jgi:type II secretion system protein H